MKTRATIVCILIAGMLLCGCSAKQENVYLDTQALAEALLTEIDFEDELNPVDSTMIKILYGIEDAEEAWVYVGSGATAEEVAVFAFATSEQAKDAWNKSQARVEEQKENFMSYMPQEIDKLSHATVKQLNQYVVVCVSSSDQVEEIIENYVNKD